jgi:hypothetical protein
VEFLTRWINFTLKGTARAFAIGNEALKVARELCLDRDEAVSREAHRLYVRAMTNKYDILRTHVIVSVLQMRRAQSRHQLY